ncbi:glycosyltransferase [Nitrospira sp. Kam-Ns4a]
MESGNEFGERKMRILHTESSLDLGGQELRVLREAEGMTKRGYPVFLAVSPDSRLRHEAEQANVPVVPIRFHKARFAGLVVDVLRAISKYEIRIVNTHGSLDSWTASVAARLSPARPVVIRTRHKSTPVTNTVRHRLLYKVLPDVIVTTGARVRESLIGQLGLCPSDVVSIPTGVDTSVFRPAARTSTLRTEVGAAAGDPLIGTVAFLRSYKGLTHLIDAAALVRCRHPEAKFLIVGEGPEQARLMAQIHRLRLSSTVMLTGFRRDVPDLLAELDVFVLSSLDGEGLPQALTQAMAMQRAVVATCVGSIPGT